MVDEALGVQRVVCKCGQRVSVRGVVELEGVKLPVVGVGQRRMHLQYRTPPYVHRPRKCENVRMCVCACVRAYVPMALCTIAHDVCWCAWRQRMRRAGMVRECARKHGRATAGRDQTLCAWERLPAEACCLLLWQARFWTRAVEEH